MDKLSQCPCCGSDACSETEHSQGKAYLCWTCGFTTNDLMIKGSEKESQTLDLTAELIKDLTQTHNDLVWYPKVINLPEKGMVFPEWNKRVKDWYWSAVKAVLIPEEDKEKYPDPNNPGKFYKFKMDMESIKRFHKHCFMDAAEEIGLFEP